MPEPESLGVNQSKVRATVRLFEDGDGITSDYIALAHQFKVNIMDNHGQYAIYDAIFQKLNEMEKIQNSGMGVLKDACFFIDGPAGTGKSYLLNGLIKNTKVEGLKVLATATTGIAADLLEGGRTLHSRFKIPLLVDKETELDIKSDSFLGR